MRWFSNFEKASGARGLLPAAAAFLEFRSQFSKNCQVYDSYVQRFRNLDYLEYELDQLNKEEEERMEQNARELKRLQKRLREEEWRMLRGATYYLQLLKSGSDEDE